uniref:Protein kinase domain-containing protein n=1 Tax=Leersia perrieri TaxID=77586 RepID=A0A0D9WCA6_9ORYZ
MTTPLLLLLFLPLLAASSASASTLAVAAGATACAVVSENSTVFCAGAGGANSSLSVPAGVAQFVRFTQVASGGGAVVCGIQLGGRALFCWPAAAPEQLRRVYNGPNPLSDLAVGGGAGHVAAYDPVARLIRWWRGMGRFPDQVAGVFGSVVSGDDFTCAVETISSSVRCWGPRGGAVEADFVNASVSSLSAGGSRACAVKTDGAGVICSGSGAGEGALVPRDVYVDGLAVGESHACGLRRPNRTAVCWILGGPTTTIYWPAVGTAFEFLVAGGNLTCGLVSSNFSLMCWSTDGSVAAEVNLPPILPGVCVAAGNNSSSNPCKCGVFPDSGRFCRVSGEVICNRFCDTPSPSSPPPPPSPPSPATPASRRGVSKWWIAFAVVGAVGCFAGICSIIYCLVFGFCSHKKIHNSVQPNLTAGNNTTTAAAAAIGSGGPSPYGSPNGSLGRLRRQLSRVMTRQRSGPSSFKDPAEEFPFSQLAAATRDFSPEFKIGEGSFGTVYRGKLADGREVAIKRGGGRKFQEKETAFRSELAFLSRLHHKHLVGFVGYCEENDERLLVYEFMKNGALYDHLHPKPSSSPATAPPLSPVATSWKLRIKILLDASRGIDYLHSYAVPPIIHRDIKSSNILIDSSWTARVSDFGLSLMGTAAPAPEAMKAAGTVGYMDPEYYGLHHLTVKSDVYGFGVVMLEVLTGKRAIFKEAEGGSPVSVVDYAVPSIVAGELAKVLDGRAPEPAPHEAEAVELVAYTAVHCVRLEGKDRPAMADIVANLETAVALCDDGGGGGAGAGGVYGNSSSSTASLSITSMELSRLD